MGVPSLEFFLLVTLTAVGLRRSSAAAERTRLALLGAANVWFIGSFVDTPAALWPLIAFLTSSWVTLLGLRAKPGRAATAGGVLWTVALFVVLKQYSFLPPALSFHEPLVTLGLSYVLFRVLHLMIDVGAGASAEGVTALSFFGYTCNFLSFVAGPIQRFEDFLRELRRESHEALTADALLQMGSRATVGMAKIALLAPMALHVHGWGVTALRAGTGPLQTAPQALQLAIAALSYLVFLYWNFSGYMDVVIAAGRFAGLSVPENFSQPFSAPNFIVLWSRWHITLSDWFRVYLFNPIVTWLTRLRPDATFAPYAGALGFLVTFFIMGIWHGTSEIFVFYGLLLGAGVSVNKLYQVQMRAWLGKRRLQQLLASFAYERLCNGLCIGFFALALCSFWLQPSDLHVLPHTVGMLDVLGALATAAGLVAAARLVHDGVRWLVTRPVATTLAASPWPRPAGLSLLLLLLVLHAALHRTDLPPFVYAEF